MKQKTGKKLLSVLLALAMVVGLMPGMGLTAYADGTTYNPASTYTGFGELIANNTEVTISEVSGQTWYVIAYDSSTVTLLSKSGFGTHAFNSNVSAGSVYANSEIKTYVDGLTGEGQPLAGISSVISDLTLIDTKTAQGLSAAKKKGEDSWWLGSTGKDNEHAAYVVGRSGKVDTNGDTVTDEHNVRPALKLNLSSVIFDSESKKFSLKPAGYDVSITADSNMTKTTGSGAASQTGVISAITDVVYTANDGYYFPTDYSVTPVNGISVTRNSYTQITVSGTPTANASITLAAPTAKTKPDAPTTAVAVDCTTADNNDGKLTGVTTAMEYKKSDATDWIAGTGSDITGLVPGTYYVRLKATNTTNASAYQELTIAEYTAPTYTVTYKVVNGTWSDDSTTDKTETVQSGSKPASVPTGMKAASGYTGGAWDTDPTGTTITGAMTFTYTFTALPSYEVTYKVVNGTWSDDSTTDKTETVQSGSKPASVPTGMKASQGFTGGAWDENPADATITGAKTFTYTFTAKQASTVTKAPTAKNLTYNGQAQALVTAGTAEGGEMQYALGTKDAATEPYTTSIPTKTDAGTYYIWYKVIGDDNHENTAPVCIPVSISKGTYTIVGSSLTWQKGSASGATFTVKRSAGDDQTFSLFRSLTIDGTQAVSPSNYKTKSGSLVLTLKPDYLNSLSAGNHTLNFIFEDGAAAATLTIQDAPAPAPTAAPTEPPVLPQTGDTADPALWLALTLLALGLAAFLLRSLGRKEN